MNILFISISGNTRSFVNKLADYAKEKSASDSLAPVIQLKEIHENSDFEKENEAYFAFVPTYLEGGNGIDNGDVEILTNVLGEYMDYEKNYELCLGIIGSGNKNFNHQYCLTAKQYAEKFAIPVLDDYELRGTTADVERIYAKLLKKIK
ncbi:nrdI protein [Enterococcus phoeniculicola]|jgi:protein involved in ribonucleotide reduction|uniref:NrdI protein n=1 Tax=Enterococcus phoeniculicola ATCC BAA-412 TaxID=1158610 RepID=R3W3X8_9ENTE|nr:class Ib ribonucleoside-diphosphate reductase assembly flavoprotein NrdI [Enterococcus phoeniculicola]EOL42347.1 nrdI protein [Enterococcus phoeniculicola ATCC BAA-412]EOT79374.1 nrdI protein [Enterococcus phoeniculicola ATCC BAA-412]OJG73087.1 nrdI protein [Enterococcus phoeniculicola]